MTWKRTAVVHVQTPQSRQAARPCAPVPLAEEAEGNAFLDMLCLNITLGFSPRSRQFGYVTSQLLKAAGEGKAVLIGLCCA